MSSFATVQDIVNSVLKNCGELTDGTSEYEDEVLDHINDWHRDILSGSTTLDIECGEPWYWARAQYPGIITLNPPIQGLSVAVINNSTAVTLSATYATSLKDFYLRTDGQVDYFRIAAHTAGSASITLDGVYTGDTVGAIGCNIYQLDYTVGPGIMRIVAPMRVYRRQTPFADDTGQIDGIDYTSLTRDYPLHRMLNGVPDRSAVIWQKADGSFKIRFNRTPAFLTRVEYDYIGIPADLGLSDSSLFPVEHRDTLCYGASYSIMLDKNDSRVAEYRELAKKALQSMVNANRKMKTETQKDMGRLIPRRDLTNYSRRYFVQEITQ